MRHAVPGDEAIEVEQLTAVVLAPAVRKTEAGTVDSTEGPHVKAMRSGGAASQTPPP
jgi:hypothetical protein